MATPRPMTPAPASAHAAAPVLTPDAQAARIADLEARLARAEALSMKPSYTPSVEARRLDMVYESTDRATNLKRTNQGKGNVLVRLGGQFPLSLYPEQLFRLVDGMQPIARATTLGKALALIADLALVTHTANGAPESVLSFKAMTPKQAAAYAASLLAD